MGQKKPMNTQTPLASHAIKICRGATGCPHAVRTQDPSAEFEAVLADSGWARFLTGQVRPVRHHHQFRLAVSCCPNGCSQPHIADFALVATARIGVNAEACSACGQCLPACAEGALHLEQAIALDPSRCLGCAACAQVCPTSALQVRDTAYRVLLGGKLGRHPRLAHELGVFSLPEALTILQRTLDHLMGHYRPGLRLGELIEKTGRPEFDRLVRP
jgi:dissimilatory sulfite reductase (desulfoviridin) alpha/beta subunit